MDNTKNSKGTPTKITSAQNGINYDYDYNTEYGDGDIPDLDKPNNSTNVIPDEVPRRDGPGGN